MTESDFLDDACDWQSQRTVTVLLRGRQRACSLQNEVEADL
jgi:hypothetical protein